MVTATIFNLTAMYGTASTGTAIATLSGAAATKATLASIGGGTLATGGLGVTGGALILGGIGVVVVLALAPVVTFAFEYKDQQEALEVVGAKIKNLKNAL